MPIFGVLLPPPLVAPPPPHATMAAASSASACTRIAFTFMCIPPPADLSLSGPNCSGSSPGLRRLALSPARHLLPRRAVRIAVGLQRAGEHLDAVAGSHRRLVAPPDDPHRVDEVLVEVVDELADAAFQRAADRHVVEDREVLDVLAQPDSTRVGAD